ncbi:selenide, water dikinase SelD [Sulfitobacter faviae]|uniref:Selenide, water dikinase SelD n=1 Tax=Sulfitobacter faviae TaxID=1775881 RepID=A0ABZ0V5D9_9RHOB|nr:selenide, water dikinase SelD [Sulfitobacter faviae]WPZ23202.1 selenide, water dikinase SelD [Sulfitobacter faviae]
MVQSDLPLTRDLVLVGGGHAHALVLRKWGMDPLPGARLTVINPGPTAPYTGMLPGHIAGHYDRDALEIDLMRLCRHAGARLILGAATGIDRAAREITVEGRGAVAYDVASIDIGITAKMDLPGFAEHAVGAKPLDRYAARWREFLAAVKAGEQPPEVAVIGGGVAGCELAMAMAFALRDAGGQPAVTVVEHGPQLSGMAPRTEAMVRRQMAELGVTVALEAKVTQITDRQVLLADGAPIPAALCVGAAGAVLQGWLAQTDLPLHAGFIRVGADLGVVDDDRLFAVGDCAHMEANPRPKAGVFAVRAAPVLHDNLRAALSGGARRVFKPQRHYLKLISLGGKSAVAERNGLALGGALLWRWKDRIDRKFMDGLDDLPAMKTDALTGPVASGVQEALAGKPLCGGCGAKVGGAVLGDLLAEVQPPVSGDVLTGAGDDAAVLRRPGGGFQVMSTDHLRGFVEDPAMMARIAAVHALGDVWAMGATPQAALSSIILPRMSPALQARTLREIAVAAQEVMAGAGAQIVGGHTTMGAELTIGFTVTGTRDAMPLGLGGAQPGDVLMLTRPIGAGVILAGHMAGTAPGRVVAEALGVMATPQAREAEILSKAHAMTDVTGFGLAGHVQAICRASGLAAELWAEAVPIYPGAQTLSDQGVASSLLAVNQADAPIAAAGPVNPLFHDPQTAGGLLAALPEDAAKAAQARLRGEGLAGHIIGRLEAGVPSIRLR